MLHRFTMTRRAFNNRDARRRAQGAVVSHERTKATYNKMAETYHAKRQDPLLGAWNRYVEEPGMERMLRPLCPGARALDASDQAVAASTGQRSVRAVL